MAALSRIANGDHAITVGEGDTVILASSLIPGNENPVNRVINGLTRWGADVVHKGNALVHVSGHASAGELLYFYNLLTPANVMPVHGEPRHLRANAALAVRTGVPADRVLIAEDGVVVDLVRRSGLDRRGRPVRARVRRWLVGGRHHRGLAEGPADPGRGGLHLGVRRRGPRVQPVVAGPELHARGFAEDDEIFRDVLPQVTRALEEALAHGGTDVYALEQVVRRQVGRWVSSTHRRRPMIVPVVVEV